MIPQPLCLSFLLQMKGFQWSLKSVPALPSSMILSTRDTTPRSCSGQAGNAAFPEEGPQPSLPTLTNAPHPPPPLSPVSCSSFSTSSTGETGFQHWARNHAPFRGPKSGHPPTFSVKSISNKGDILIFLCLILSTLSLHPNSDGDGTPMGAGAVIKWTL